MNTERHTLFLLQNQLILRASNYSFICKKEYIHLVSNEITLQFEVNPIDLGSGDEKKQLHYLSVATLFLNIGYPLTNKDRTLIISEITCFDISSKNT